MTLDVPWWMMLPFLFVVGTVIGSFLNVCIHRLPQYDSLWPQLKGLSWPPSHCPNCKNNILRGDNVPVLGWLMLRGRCRSCRIPISPRYPLIEFANGLLWVLVYWVEMPADVRRGIADASLYVANIGPQMFNGWSDSAWLHWRYLYHMVLIEALVVATFIDFDKMIIPDGSTIPAMIVGILGGWGFGQVFVMPVWFQNSRDLHIFKTLAPEWLQQLFGETNLPAWIPAHPHWHGLAASVAGLLMGGGIVWGVRLIGGWILRREAMGFGDVVLMAMIGSFLGWQATLIVFFLAPFCAILFALTMLIVRRDRVIPYGPYLSAAVLVMILGWKWIWPRARPIFELGPIVPLLIVTMFVLLAGCLLVMQGAKWVFGIPLTPPPQWEDVGEEWRSADQLAFFAGGKVDEQHERWRSERWQGHDAGRGTSFEDRWRRSSSSHHSPLQPRNPRGDR